MWANTHTQKGALAIEDEGVNPLGTFTINTCTCTCSSILLSIELFMVYNVPLYGNQAVPHTLASFPSG